MVWSVLIMCFSPSPYPRMLIARYEILVPFCIYIYGILDGDFIQTMFAES